MTRRESIRPAGRGQSRLIVTLLVASVLLTTLLAWQAVQAVEYHRVTAEGVLRDYAALAADEFVRRTASEVGYYGYLPVLTLLARSAGQQERPPSPADLTLALQPAAREAAGLVRQTFWVLDGVVRTSGDDPALSDWLGDALAAPPSESPPGPISALHGRLNDRLVSAIYSRRPPPGPEIVGFEVQADDLAARFRRSFERGPLLPQSLTQGAAAEGWIRLVAYDRSDAPLFRSGAQPTGPLAAEAAFGDTYGGVLDGWRVIASIEPAAAERLVIGGLPRSRLPLLLGLLSLTVGLLVAAIFQLRRERALTDLRSEFVSRVSHELRTPLTQIRMFAETLLLDRVRDDGERRRALTIIDREARRLTHLVENVLQFSRGERGAVRLVRRRRELAPLVREVIREFEPLAPDSRLSLRGAGGAEGGTAAEVDEDALRQVLLNLLDNAVKYGPAGQHVVVDLQAVGDAVRIRVEDEGPGIPARDRERVWQRFHRLDRNDGAESAGTGIGLAVVRELVQLHGGRTWIESGGRGGACVVVELPSSGVPAAADAVG